MRFGETKLTKEKFIDQYIYIYIYIYICDVNVANIVISKLVEKIN